MVDHRGRDVLLRPVHDRDPTQVVHNDEARSTGTIVSRDVSKPSHEPRSSGDSRRNTAQSTTSYWMRFFKRAPWQPQKHRKWLYHVYLWQLQWAAMLLSLTLFAAIIGVLIGFHNRPLGSWNAPWHIQPNTLISVLVSLCKLPMLVVVTDGLGQLKWVYFHEREPHPLSHFQIFDDASRGPWGSTVLFCTVRWKAAVASLGAITTVLALGMEAFAQQALSFVPHNTTADEGATIWRAQAYDHYADLSMVAGSRPFLAPRGNDLAISSVIQGALAGLITSQSNHVPFDCSTNNCTWAGFKTLAVCSTCTSVSDHLQPNCTNSTKPTGGGQSGECYYTTPMGAQLGVQYSFANSSTNVAETYTVWNSTSLPFGPLDHVPRLPVLARLSSILLPLNGFDVTCDNVTGSQKCITTPPEAYDCTVSWCVKAYDQDTVINGTLVDYPTQERSLEFPFDPRQDCPHAGSNTTSEDERCTGIGPPGSIANQASQPPPLRLAALSADYGPSDARGITWENRTSYSISEMYWVNFLESQLASMVLSTVFTQAASTSDLGGFGQLMYSSYGGNFSKIMSEIATGMTNAIRLGPNATAVHGTAIRESIYIRVNWPWLVYPAMLLLLTFVFMVLTFFFSKENSAVVWKTSSLAVLYHGLKGWSAAELDKDDPGDMEATSKECMAKLERDADGLLKLIRS